MSAHESIRLGRLAILALAALPLCAAIDGVVMNGTTGKPVAGAQVSLVQPSQSGMNTLGTQTTDEAGKFSFPQSAARGPQLLQAVYQGVTYNKLATPGTPLTGLQIDVYEATKTQVGKISQDMILLQPGPSVLTVNQTFLIEDNAKLTYSDPEKGAVQFYVPPQAKAVQVVVNAPGGMPLPKAADKTSQANVFKVVYPIKPGETRIDLAYTLPTTNPSIFESKVLHQEGKARLVVPNGVALKGAGIQEIGKEPQTQATIYDLTSKEYRVEISGTGALEGPAAEPGEDPGQPQIEESPPHIYDHIYVIAGLAFGILGLGTILLLNREAPATNRK